MPNYIQVLTKKSRPYLKTIHDDYVASKDKDFFKYTGTQIYCGPQGSGKTASAVYHLQQLKANFPKSVVVSNLLLTGLIPLTFGTKDELSGILRHIDPRKHYIRFHDMSELSLALVGVNNGKFGVIYIIDEIHTYLNALDSKNIPMFVFTEISQQRKQRKCIIGTSQLFLRIAKPLREQCDNIIMCDTYFGVLTVQRAYKASQLEQDYDGTLKGVIKRRGWFIQTRELRAAYDTYQKVVSAQEQFDLQKPLEIVNKSKNPLAFGKR